MCTKLHIQKIYCSHNVVNSRKAIVTDKPVVEYTSANVLSVRYYTNDTVINEQSEFELDDNFTKLITEKDHPTVEDFVQDIEDQVFEAIETRDFLISSDVIAHFILIVQSFNEEDIIVDKETEIKQNTDRFFDSKDEQMMFKTEVPVDSTIINGSYESYSDSYDDESDPN